MVRTYYDDDGGIYCCEQAFEWGKHSKEMSKKLTEMIPTKTVTTGQFGQYPKKVEDLERLDSANLVVTRDFARKILTNKCLHTKTWTHEKLVSLEQRITEQIEVFY